MAAADRKRSDGDIRRVPVLLAYPFAGPLDYRVPAGCDPRPGDVVLVPLNRREETGVVWDPPDAGAEPGAVAVPDRKLKPLIAVIDTPPMKAELRRLIDWMAAYTLAAPGEVMAMALRAAHRASSMATGWRLADPLPETRLTEARRRVVEVLGGGRGGEGEGGNPFHASDPSPPSPPIPSFSSPVRSTADLAQAASVSPGVIRGMADAGLQRQRAVGRATARRRHAAPGGGRARVLRHFARWRHRLRQD
jgi:primosomal protein N'